MNVFRNCGVVYHAQGEILGPEVLVLIPFFFPFSVGIRGGNSFSL